MRLKELAEITAALAVFTSIKSRVRLACIKIQFKQAIKIVPGHPNILDSLDLQAIKKMRVIADGWEKEDPKYKTFAKLMRKFDQNGILSKAEAVKVANVLIDIDKIGSDISAVAFKAERDIWAQNQRTAVSASTVRSRSKRKSSVMAARRTSATSVTRRPASSVRTVRNGT